MSDAELIEKVKAALERATPGPWVRDCWDILGSGDRESGTGHVCEVTTPSEHDEVFWKEGETDANAALIALAPAMAAALLAAHARERSAAIGKVPDQLKKELGDDKR